MTPTKPRLPDRLVTTVVLLAAAARFACWFPQANADGGSDGGADSEIDSIESVFRQRVQPLLDEFCFRCHNVDKMKSGVRLDLLNGALEDRQLFLLRDMLGQLLDEAMPPEDEAQPTAGQRRVLVDWIGRSLRAAERRPREKNGSVRRLTVAQYRNTLRDLLGIEEDLTDVLPPDGVSEEGFRNNGRTMLLTPLMVEAYFSIAAKALDLCIVDEEARPAIQNFRVELGASINPEPCPDKLMLNGGRLLANQDFVVTQLVARKPFDFDPFFMRTKFEFIEGYQGNNTVRGWRTFEGIYHAVFSSIIGSTPRGADPKGERYRAAPEGLLLRPAVPGVDDQGQPLRFGPAPTFSIALRELPNQGRFRVTVEAARYDDGLLLDPGAPRIRDSESVSIAVAGGAASTEGTVTIADAGVYQVEVHLGAGESQGVFHLDLGERQFSGRLFEIEADVVGRPSGDAGSIERLAPFLQVRLPAGPLRLKARYGDNARLRGIVLFRLDDRGESVRRFRVFERRSPRMSVHLGVRRDCGTTLSPVGEPQTVSSGTLNKYFFHGAIGNFPNPEIEKNNVNYLAGFREFGVRSEYTDGRDMPRLLVRSVEFEGPFYETWPPRTHTNLFFDSPRSDEPAAYAREIIEAFAARSFRRPITEEESAGLVAVWEDSFSETRNFRESVKNALLVVLTSPQFLFLIEDSESPEAEPLDAHELASKLSYFLWNGPPDSRLMDLASADTLHGSLDREIDRMIRDSRFLRFADPFTSQWLDLDKFDVVDVDHERYPKLTPATRRQLRQEPVQFLKYLVDHNLSLRHLVQSDLIVANEVVADYYGLGPRTERGFEFIPVKHESPHLGGVLTQAAILAGLSDGRESNPVKRGAWLARKIVAEPPDDPPPNVPALPEDGEGDVRLTLREKLERHRSQEGCAECHSRIDPWGLPLEQFDAGGLFKSDPAVDASSTLPDQTEVADAAGLRAHLAGSRIDQVAFSFLTHLASYATGRSLDYNEVEYLRQEGLQLKPDGYRMRDMFHFVIQSPIFLEK